ncbi:MAG: hypothetical protein LBJ69_00500 [Holosporales bacterium]|jgi:D-alanyl-lipoteichoic acid acyltransferase DltB (MBOAT superfamily)|nr:hypothetical protein [Holosporales bacterium]
MLELFELNTINANDIVFSVLAIGMLAFATLSIMAKTQMSAVIRFLLASLFLSYFVVVYGNLIIGVIVAVIYVSMCSLLLLMARSSTQIRQPLNKWLMAIPLAMIGSFILVGHRLNVVPPTREAINQYTRIAGGMTLMMILVFITVFAGVAFLIMHRKRHTGKADFRTSLHEEKKLW